MRQLGSSSRFTRTVALTIVTTFIASSMPAEAFVIPIVSGLGRTSSPLSVVSGFSRTVAAPGAQTSAQPPKVTVNRTVPIVAPPPAFPVFSSIATGAEITRARVFPEPLVPIGPPPSPRENQALARAITTYLSGGSSEAVAPLLRFLLAYPDSVWRASLLLNIGGVYRRTGYLSRALRAWDEAWRLAQPATTREGRAVADLAVGEWLDLAVTLGQTEAASARLAALRGRDLGGTAALKVASARERLGLGLRFESSIVPSGVEAIDAILARRGGAAHREPAALEATAARPGRAGLTLVQVQDLATAAGLPGVMAFRDGDLDLPVPSIVHWRAEHFAAILQQDGNRYLVRDTVLGGERWVTRAAINDEASGYFLIPGTDVPAGWRAVDNAEGRTIVGHSGCPPGPPTTVAPPGGPGGCPGMPVYWFQPVQASLVIGDTPVGYAPPRGPAVSFRLIASYWNQDLPQSFTFSNLGPKWTHDWLSYVTDDPTRPDDPVSVYLRGAGVEWFSYPDANGIYGAYWRSRAVLVRTSTSPIRYERRLRDGGVEVYGQADGTATAGRRIFLTQVLDPQGQALTLTYDGQLRLVALTDAIGQVTTLSYELPSDPLRITTVTDPFGRAAHLSYTPAGQLAAITDVIGLTSSFVYGATDFIASMTTPYGTTTFRHDLLLDPANARFVEATDPLGGVERLEFRYQSETVAASEPANEVPTGFAAANVNLDYYNSFYWDKRAMREVPRLDSHATITHWLLKGTGQPGSNNFSEWVPHSIKKPLERRVWYAYPDQVSPDMAGSWTQPTNTARVLDDGTSQINQATYNGQGQVTSRSDPLGRRTSSTYAANGIDLLEVRQTTGSANDLLAQYAGYTAQHQPQSVTDAAGQVTTLTYNAAGQPLTSTNAKNETTTYAYDSSGNLLSVTGPVSGATTSYSYDGFGRVRTMTDADGYTVTTDYDALDRPTRVTYPDGTYEETTYERLDLGQRRDRAGRITRYWHDALRRQEAVRDPAGRTITQVWCESCGSLDQLIDAKGQATIWERDVQGRVTREVRADGVTATVYSYENMTSRLKTVTDPKGQVTTYTYNLDDTVQAMTYTNAQIPTPTVSFTYDPVYNQVATMLDGTGTTSYTYHPVGVLGAGQVASVDGPLPSDMITYAYDELGRVLTRAVNGVGVTWGYDALGRTTSEQNVLGTFTYGYAGTSGRLATVAYPNGQTSTYSYFGNLGDQRLQTIHHKYPNGTTLSKFDYTYDTLGNILTWHQQADQDAVLWRYGYDAADQLTAAIKHATDPQETILKRYFYTYDPAGNRTSEQIDDSITTDSHDVLNRLVTQTPGGALMFRGHLDEPGTVTIQGKAATLSPDNRFEGTAQLTSGTNTVIIVATDTSGNQTMHTYEVDIAGSAKSFTYDANGNLISDGTRTFEWDGANRLYAIGAGATRTQFTYDGSGRRVRDVEFTGGSVTGDHRLIWCGPAPCEKRTGPEAVVSERYFSDGIQVGDTHLFFAKDHLFSLRELTDVGTGIRARYEYDPYGRRTRTSGDREIDVGYARLWWQAASGLHLANYRPFDSEIGRWLSEDPLRHAAGINFYAYGWDNPIRWVDFSGLSPQECKIGPAPKPCKPYPHRDIYYSCVAYMMVDGSTAKMALVCLAAGTFGTPVAGFACGAATAFAIRLMCLDCATFCDETGPKKCPYGK